MCSITQIRRGQTVRRGHGCQGVSDLSPFLPRKQAGSCLDRLCWPRWCTATTMASKSRWQMTRELAREYRAFLCVPRSVFCCIAFMLTAYASCMPIHLLMLIPVSGCCLAFCSHSVWPSYCGECKNLDTQPLAYRKDITVSGLVLVPKVEAFTALLAYACQPGSQLPLAVKEGVHLQLTCFTADCVTCLWSSSAVCIAIHAI